MQLIKQLNLFNALKKDQSAMILVLSNVIIIIFALVQQWDILVIMLGYWLQSVIIGFFVFIRIINLKKFSVKNVKVNGKPLEETKKAKISTALFFAFHYGFFHFVYFGFLMEFATENQDLNLTEEIFPILIMGAIFFLNHLFSSWYNRKEFEKKKPNIGKMMLFPYARIIPMHLTIIFSGSIIVSGSTNGLKLFLIPLFLFLSLKTIADLTMHIIEHQGFED